MTSEPKKGATRGNAKRRGPIMFPVPTTMGCVMMPIRPLLRLFGSALEDDELVAILSARLDESGTDGRSPYTVVGGAVASMEQWNALEVAWARLLGRNHISSFHFKEFQERSGEFDGWGDLKCKRFSDAQAKIIRRNTIFRTAVGVENAVHAEIKGKMKGIKGFKPDSNYSLCFRYLMFLACENIKEIISDARIAFMLEDGPWASGAVDVYTQVSGMGNSKWRPAKHAQMLGGISVVPKGQTLTLEAADYLVGRAHRQMSKGRLNKKDKPQVSILLDRSFLERWYQGMLDEKERRREYGRRRSIKSD